MKPFKLILSALALLLMGVTLSVNATSVATKDVKNSYFESEGDSVWKIDEALITNASQITANNSQNGFPPCRGHKARYSNCKSGCSRGLWLWKP